MAIEWMSWSCVCIVCPWWLTLMEMDSEWKYINHFLLVWPWRGHFTSGLQQTRFELCQNKRRGRNFKGINTSFWFPHCMLPVWENKARWGQTCVLTLLNEGEIKYFRRAWDYFSEIKKNDTWRLALSKQNAFKIGRSDQAQYLLGSLLS